MNGDVVFKESFYNYFKKHYWAEVYKVPNFNTFNSNLASFFMSAHLDPL